MRIVVVFVVALMGSMTLRAGDRAAADSAVPKTLCDVLGSVEAGDEFDVTIAATYMEGPETRALYSEACDGTFQPATWVEFSTPAQDVERLRDLVDRVWPG